MNRKRGACGNKEAYLTAERVNRMNRVGEKFSVTKSYSRRFPLKSARSFPSRDDRRDDALPGTMLFVQVAFQACCMKVVKN